MKEKEDIKLMYVSPCGVDVITSVSRLEANASLTLTNQHSL